LAVVSNYDLFQIDRDAKLFSSRLIDFLQPMLKNRERARIAANARWNNQRIQLDDPDAQAMLKQCSSNAPAMQSKVKESKVKEKKRIKTDAFQRPEFISEKLWIDFLDNRKFKNLQNSEAALTVICNRLREAVNAGYTIDQCIEAYITSKWQRFKPEWMENINSTQAPRSKRDDANEIRSNWARELLNAESTDNSDEGLVHQIQGPPTR
jgi:hypothetical protein